LEGGSGNDALGSDGSVLDATTVAEAEAGNLKTSLVDSGGETGQDDALGKDGSVGDAGREGLASLEGGPDAPSCAPGGPGMTNCGPGASGMESCCTSMEVTGGTYFRTYTNDGGGPTGEADPATVSSFRLDNYDVTVGRFRQFVSAWSGGLGWTPPAGSGKHTHLNSGNGLNAAGGGYEPGWVAADDSNIAPTNANLTACSPFSTWTDSAGSQENLPIECVNWYESYAFCIWDGGFLPSEAEWEYAAAGGSEQREYPWGSTAPGTANQYSIYSCCYPGGSGSCDPMFGCSGLANFASVGTAALGAGRWGQLDLSGDVWDWNMDFATQSYVEPCTDCAYLTPPQEGGNQREWRGAYCGAPASELLTAGDHGTEDPAGRHFYLGFRCARTP
jgi:formylglycine-generating enzyme